MKTPLIERMAKREGTPKTWIAEVAKLQKTIKEKDEVIENYGNIIDVLARKVEGMGEPCSICGLSPAVQVIDTYWLCGECVFEKVIEDA